MSIRNYLPAGMADGKLRTYFTDRADRVIDTPRNATVAIALVLVAAVITLLNNNYFYHIAVLIGLYGSVAVALDVLAGYTGQVSIMHAGIMGIGAYTSAILTLNYGFPLWAGFLAACLLATVVGLLIGMAAFRTAGHYFVLTTLAVAVLIATVFELWEPVTGGPQGISGIYSPGVAISVGGMQLVDFSTTRGYFYIVVLYLIATVAIVNNILDSRIGRSLIAVRENADLASSHGIDTKTAKLTALGISCLFAGGAGSLYAHYFGYINPAVFDFFSGFEIVVMTIVGGMGSLIGGIIGAIFITITPEVLRDYPEVSELIFGVVLLVVVLYFPGGIWGTLRSWWTKIWS